MGVSPMSGMGVSPMSPPAVPAGALDTDMDFLQKMHGRPIRRPKVLLATLMGEVRV